jgi:restriction system protein
MLPKQLDIEIPLLQVLIEIGGNGRARSIYPLVTKKFPSITDEDLKEELASGGNKWTNRIQWVRQKLIESGDMGMPERGIWEITEKGRERIQTGADEVSNEKINVHNVYKSINMQEIYEEYDEKFREQLLEKLFDLTPSQFENFAKRLLSMYGFIHMEVTSISSDGGVDGYGKLKIGLASMNVAFQCKKWQGNIGRPEIDKFRGAIQGEFEQGIFFTTSDFTDGATEVSLKKGAVPIILLNGGSIVDLMIQKGFGVTRKPIQIYEIDENVFYEEE